MPSPCSSSRVSLTRRAFLIKVGSSSIAASLLTACQVAATSPASTAHAVAVGTSASVGTTSSTPASSRAAASQPARSIKTATITFMHWQVTPQELKRTVYGPATQFEHAHPGVHVSVIIAPAGPSYVEKLLTMIAGGVPPDVIGLGGPAAGLPVLASKGALADLSPLIDRDAAAVQPHDFYPQALVVGQWQGKQYGLIISPLSTAVLVYNADALRKAGIDQTPAQMYDAGKWTWNDFATVARQATMRASGNSMPSQYGFLVPFDIQMGSSFLWEAGGHLLNPQRTKCLLDTAQSVQGLQFLYDLQHKEQIGPPPALQGSASPFGQFTSGRLAMTINWAHQVAITYGPVHFAWDIAPLPVGPQGEIVNDNFNNIALSAKSKHAEEAWSFIKYMTSGPVYLEKEHTALPPRRSVYQAWLKWMQELPRPKNIQYLALLRKHSRSLPYLPVWPQINVTWPKWTSYLADGTRSPTTVARSLTSAIDAILKQQSA